MKKNIRFGDYIKLLRTTRAIGQRELARQIGVAASYLNDIEKNKRHAHSKKIIKKLADILEGNLEYFYDLAGKAQKKAPHDVIDILKENESAVRLLRAIKNANLGEIRIGNIIRTIKEENMKAIIKNIWFTKYFYSIIQKPQ